MATNKALIKFSKFLVYILGRKPDEFGLVPDKDGFVKIKELLKAINEEDGWRHIRKATINELAITLPHPAVDIKDNLIRAVSRDNIPKPKQIEQPPGLMYTCIRQRAYPHALEKGITPMGQPHIILSANKAFAERMGKRIDQKPVVLTVHVNNAIKQQVRFLNYGSLFLTDFLPPSTFSGPPLPKEKTDLKTRERADEIKIDYHPGSFNLDLNRDKTATKSFGAQKKQKGADWKKDRKKLRKQKEKMWPT